MNLRTQTGQVSSRGLSQLRGVHAPRETGTVFARTAVALGVGSSGGGSTLDLEASMGQGDHGLFRGHVCAGGGVSQEPLRAGVPGGDSCRGRHGWAGLVCVPTGVCWRRRGRPTRQATSSGWAPTAGAPRAPPCCTWRRWPRALSLSSPRGCQCEVGPAAPDCTPTSLSPAPTVGVLPSFSLLLSPHSIPYPLLIFPHSVFPLPWPTPSLCSCSRLDGLSSYIRPSRIQTQIQELSSPFSDIFGCGRWVVRTGSFFIKVLPSSPHPTIPSPICNREPRPSLCLGHVLCQKGLGATSWRQEGAVL